MKNNVIDIKTGKPVSVPARALAFYFSECNCPRCRGLFDFISQHGRTPAPGELPAAPALVQRPVGSGRSREEIMHDICAIKYTGPEYDELRSRLIDELVENNHPIIA